MLTDTEEKTGHGNRHRVLIFLIILAAVFCTVFSAYAIIFGSK